MFMARGLKRSKRIHSCWSKEGRLYIRELNSWGQETPSGRIVQIHKKEDLDVYHEQGAVMGQQ